MKTVIITGVSSGFGFLTMEQLLERGHRVVGLVRGGLPRMQKLAGNRPWFQKAQELGVLEFLDVHLEKPETHDRVEDWLQANPNRTVDVLINNAGFGVISLFQFQSEAQWREQMEVNYFAPMILTRRLLPWLMRSQGKVIFVSSLAGLYSFPGYGVYCATKHALEAHVEALEYELRPLGVQCSLVEPGGFKTAFTENSVRKVGASSAEGIVKQWLEEKTETFGQNPARVAKLLVDFVAARQIPARRLIGFDAWAIHAFSRVVPDRLRRAAVWNALGAVVNRTQKEWMKGQP